MKRIRWKPATTRHVCPDCMGDLGDEEMEIFVSGQCPDCGGPLYEGPSGGASTNYYCGGLGESRFNYMGPFGVERIGNSRCPILKKGERFTAPAIATSDTDSKTVSRWITNVGSFLRKLSRPRGKEI